MPEAAGSSSAPAGAFLARNRQAGFPDAGGPLFRPAVLRAALALLVVATLFPLPLAARSAEHHAGPATPGFLAAETAAVNDAALREELHRVGTDFRTMVTDKTLARVGRKPGRRVDLLTNPDQRYRDRVRADALARLQAAGADLAASQYLVYADRNPATQIVFLAFYDAGARTVRLLGADFMSSGKLRPGEDSFITPVGVFENLPEHWGYRAQGTRNNRGWRGLGGKGSRVWDFGYQQAPRQFRQGVYDSEMRLLMHATDPDHGEPRLGGPDSKGCVRISAAANAFFDRYSILDRHYEQLAATEKDRDMWLLRADRVPVSHPGSYLVVGDSATGSASN